MKTILIIIIYIFLCALQCSSWSADRFDGAESTCAKCLLFMLDWYMDERLAMGAIDATAMVAQLACMRQHEEH